MVSEEDGGARGRGAATGRRGSAGPSSGVTRAARRADDVCDAERAGGEAVGERAGGAAIGERAGGEAIARWLEESEVSAVAVLSGDRIVAASPAWRALERVGDAVGWQVVALDGRPASRRRKSLRELVLLERGAVAPGAPLRCERLDRQQAIDLCFAQGARHGDREVVITATDATRAHRMEQELAAARDALSQKQRLLAIGELASGVAHDLNNSLYGLRLRVTVLERNTRCVAAAGANIAALGRIVDDATAIVSRLLDAARPKGERKDDAVDLATVVADAIEMARPEVEQKAALEGIRVQIRSSLPEELSPVPGSAPSLRHLFLNLLLNARAAMPKGGLVEIAAREEGSQVVVTVSDTGTGILPEHLPRIFDPFFTTKGKRGTGLGLSMASSVMTTLGGRIDASNRPGGGAMFTLRFPMSHSLVDRPSRLPPAPAGLPKSVLLVDDQEDNLDAARALLESEGHRVELAQGGTEALARVRAGQRFDVVLCDLGMPDMNGWSLADALRSLAPETSVYMLTGWAHEIADDDPRRGLVRGVLPKPVDFEHLKRVLAKAPAIRAARASSDRE